MMSPFKNIITLIIILTFFMGGIAFAEESDTKTKKEDLEETTEELYKAQDEDSPFDILLRIKTFKKVIELSISEIKDLKINLIAIDKIEENLKNWQNITIEELNKIIQYYENSLKEIEDKEEPLTLEEIQVTASDFKIWRKDNYISIQNKIQNLFLIKNEKKALEISNRRIEKINNDIEILQKAKIGDTDKLINMFQEAKEFIKIAENKNKEAFQIFIKQNEVKETKTATSTSDITTSTIVENTTTTTTSTIDTTTSTEENTTTTSTSTISTTSTLKSATSTDNDTTTTIITTNTTTTTTTPIISTSTIGTDRLNDDSNKSIRDLISVSWNNIKAAYQIFIEMSGFVRKSLE